ncbi:MAG: DUF362 domain-containing protein [candidate division Zixibacteria bacterium]|nr:DUF362 domain-containing protein [candidate division Zixibacteria bacterium]
MPGSKVVVLKTSVENILEDYQKLLHLLDYQKYLSKEKDSLIKLNLSWTKYFPACSTQPWQLEGVVKTLIEDGFKKERIFPVENKTVVTDPLKGAKNNRWLPVLEKYGLKFQPLPEVEWVKYEFKEKLLRLNQIFPEGIEIPKLYIGKQIIHLPTLKTHGHSITTGAVKNAFGGLLKEVRHYAHKYIHEVLVDLMIIQKELHPGILAVMDGTVCGDGAGPRTMHPVIKNYILASNDSVAIDAVAAKLMGFDPLQISYIRLSQEKGLGTGDPKEIEIIGEDISSINFGFRTKKSFVIWGDQMLRLGPLRFLEKVALKSPLVLWAPLASNLYHDYFWYPLIGRARINKFKKTDWGKLFERY